MPSIWDGEGDNDEFGMANSVLFSSGHAQFGIRTSDEYGI
jgi:hypothetical protein